MNEPQKQSTRGTTRLADPRNRSEFQPARYPRANGQDAPAPEATERNAQIQLLFLTVYYELNCAHARLVAARNQSTTVPDHDAEKKILQEIERLLIVRDQLEDEYAPFGVIVEPVVEEGFTVDLKISFGNVDAAGKLRSTCYTITACMPIALPKKLQLEKLSVEIEGPGLRAE